MPLFQQPFMMSWPSINRSSICTTQVYSDTTRNSNFNLGYTTANAGVRYGLQIDAGFSDIGKYIKLLRFNVAKAGSPTGNCYAKVYNSSNVEQATSSALDVSTLTTSPTFSDEDFDLGSNYQIQEGDRIVLEYTNGDASNYIAVAAHNTSSPSNTTHIAYISGSWSDPNSAWTPTHTWDYNPTCP